MCARTHNGRFRLLTPPPSLHSLRWIYGRMAYEVFRFMFGWTDTNWGEADKGDLFRSAPFPQSSRHIFHWSQVGRSLLFFFYFISRCSSGIVVSAP